MATMKEISIRGGKIIANQTTKTVSSGVVKDWTVGANPTQAEVSASAKGMQLNVQISGYSDYKLPEQFKYFPEVSASAKGMQLNVQISGYSDYKLPEQFKYFPEVLRPQEILLLSSHFRRIFDDLRSVNDKYFMDIGKNFYDAKATQEVFITVVDSQRVFQDVQQAVNRFAVMMHKPYSELFTKTEQVRIATNKAFKDVRGNSEVFFTVTQFVRTPGDVQHAVERIAVDFNKSSLLTNFGKAEKLVFHFTLRPVDTLQAIEAFDYGSGIAQQVMNPDELNSVLEEQLKAFSKVFAEDAVHTEDYRNLIHKPYFDTQEIRELVEWVSAIAKHDEATTEDSGFVNNQGYFLGNYVAHGYIGQNTYF